MYTEITLSQINCIAAIDFAKQWLRARPRESQTPLRTRKWFHSNEIGCGFETSSPGTNMFRSDHQIKDGQLLQVLDDSVPYIQRHQSNIGPGLFVEVDIDMSQDHTFHSGMFSLLSADYQTLEALLIP